MLDEVPVVVDEVGFHVREDPGGVGFGEGVDFAGEGEEVAVVWLSGCFKL